MKKILLLAMVVAFAILAVAGCSTGGESDGPAPSPTLHSHSEVSLDEVLGPVTPGAVAPQPDSVDEPQAARDEGKGAGNLVVVISDIHMGDQRSIDDGYAWFINNEDLLADFLNHIAVRPTVQELVIAGDMFDEWVIPMAYDTFNGFGSGQDGESKFVDSIAQAHPDVISAVNNVIASGVKVTYVPGNHDMLVTREDIDRIFPGINQQRDAAGLGAYSPDGLPEVVIEHSHRYDFFNAPDMYSNRIPSSPVNYTDNPDALLPPGFFVSKIAATHGLEYPALPQLGAQAENTSGPFLYWAAWNLIMTQIPVTEDHNAKVIKSGIDGYTGVYAINDLVPPRDGLTINQPLLYQLIEDNWKQRQARNLVNVPISVASALLVGSVDLWCDFQAYTQYFFHDSSKRIVVFGHTHHATECSRINYKLKKCIYANSGTWIDKGDPARTFVVIKTQPNYSGGTDEYVGVFQFTEKHTAIKLHEDTITK
jgi:UDP-2,3-diacylglucosamine pyrophosphatase LpxH